MRQMFDASQIMTVRDISTLLKGIGTTKPKTITVEEMSKIINSDVIYFNATYYFNFYPKYKLSTFIEDEYEFYFYGFPRVGSVQINQNAVAFTYNPSTKLVDVTLEMRTFKNA